MSRAPDGTRVSHSGEPLTREDLGEAYTTTSTGSVGSGFDFADGWHYAYLRRQGDLAGLVFESDLCRPFECPGGGWQGINGAVSMSRARPVHVDSRARFFAIG